MKNLFYLILAAGLLVSSCTGKNNLENKEKNIVSVNQDCGDLINFSNGDFYDENGQFLESKAKEAIIALAKYHGYPVFPGFKENLWVSDYGTGRFTELGLAAHLFINNEKDRYMLMDLFLLPGQMLPEHWHLDGETNPAKLEGWLIRYGESYIVGAGEENLNNFPEIKIPDCHMNGTVTTKHVIPANLGSFTPQDILYSRHWQFGGAEGAIITEVANVHTDAAVRHSDKAINDNFLGI